jgi:hypothetical protein
LPKLQHFAERYYPDSSTANSALMDLKFVNCSPIAVDYSSWQTLSSSFKTGDFGSCCPFIGSVVINSSFGGLFVFGSS